MASEQLKEKDIIGCIVIILLVTLFTTCMFCGKESESEKASVHYSNKDLSIDSWVRMQYAIEARLKSPKSADFEYGGSMKMKKSGLATYCVDSYVDSQNSFGAEIRTRFKCCVTWTSDKDYTIDSLEFY